MDLSDLPPLVAGNADQIVDNVDCLSSDSEYDTDDEEDVAESTTCLFCCEVAPNIEVAIKHLKDVHSINLITLKQKFSMNQYLFLQLINCIRTEKLSAEKISGAEKIFWNDEKYLKPVDYEPWLTYDYESLPTNAASEHLNEKSKITQNSENTIRELQQQVQEKSTLLEQAYEDIKKMREVFQRLMIEKGNLDTESKPAYVNCVSSISDSADESYFSSYAHFGIHHEMLSDAVRTTSYKDALLKNEEFIQGKDVLDVGCGTSVLSIFASQAGARKVVGIDKSDIIFNAMDIIKKNNISNVELIKGRLEDTELPQLKYDIIISEWMGYFLLFEGMLDSIIYARDHNLKDGGIILPNRCTMSIVGYGNDALYARYVTYWSNVYGLDMSNMRKEVMHEPLIEVVDPKFILTENNIIANLDMATVDLNYSNFSYDLKLKCLSDGILSSLVGFFDTFFELPTTVAFSTGPTHKPTHWKQVVFFLSEPKNVKANEVIEGKIICSRSKSNARSLEVKIDIFGKIHTYYID